MENSKLKVGVYLDKSCINDDFNNNYEIILKKYGYGCVRMNIDDNDFWEKIKELDLFIYRYSIFDESKQIANTILPIIEKNYKIRVIPPQKNCWHYDDKIKEYYLSKCYNLPMVQSWIFWDRKKALEWADKIKYPIVFKLKGGASSINVLLIKSSHQAKRIINKMFTTGIFSNNLPFFSSTRFVDFNIRKWIRNVGRYFYKLIKMEDANLYWQVQKNYVFFQKYLPNNEFDTRVTLIGNRAFAFRRYNRKGDFRSSGSGKKDYDHNKIDLEIIKSAFKINEKFNFTTMAFDFLYNEENKPEFCEMSYTFPDKTIFDLPGYWDIDLLFHPGHFWPQYLILLDELNIPE